MVVSSEFTYNLINLGEVLDAMEYPSLNLVSAATTQKSFPATAIVVLQKSEWWCKLFVDYDLKTLQMNVSLKIKQFCGDQLTYPPLLTYGDHALCFVACFGRINGSPCNTLEVVLLRVVWSL